MILIVCVFSDKQVRMRSFVFLAFLSSVKICSTTESIKEPHKAASLSNSNHSEYLTSNKRDNHSHHCDHHHGYHHDHNHYYQHVRDPDEVNPNNRNVSIRRYASDNYGPKHHKVHSNSELYNDSSNYHFRRHAPNTSFTRMKKDPDVMVFPADEAAASMESQTRLKAPNFSSRNCTFGLCEEVDDYPAEKISRIISRSREFKQYFEEMAENKIDINNRFGEEGDTMCSTMTHTKFPQSARNTNNVQMLLVNVGDYKQGIFYETCLNDGAACMYSEIFPDGYTTMCKQKYTVRRLMAVLKESDKAIFDNFELPSCCVCMVKKP